MYSPDGTNVHGRPQPPNLVAAAEKITAAENPPRKNAVGHNPAMKK